MIRRPPRSTQSRSSAASDVYKRQSSLGAVSYLVKPVTRDQLHDAIKRQRQPIRSALVVDDDQRFVRLIRRMLRTLLEPESEILSAHNGKEALEILQHRSIELVLLDLMMPEVSGMEVLAAMSGDERLAAIPVIVTSAHEQGGGHFSLDGTISISKPDGFQVEELLRAVEALCGAVD